jgi:predicted CopG family antitoxin
VTHKTVDISQEAYKKLTELKSKDESISSFILRLINEKKKSNSIEEFAGAFEEDSEEWEKIEKILYEDRLKNKMS